MQIFSDTRSLRQHLQPLRQAGKRVGLVPTMGNLHAGHMRLVEQARQDSDIVVATIFVNPMQFGPDEDLQRYPRTPEDDLALLAEHACDVVFMPAVEVMYPNGLQQQTVVSVPALSERHCGTGRPGHFDGVATVVSKLFNLVQPDLAFFGQKDYQQLAIIRKLCADLCFAISIIGVETVREASGLALSSRNHYLSEAEKVEAGRLSQTLRECAGLIGEGERNYAKLELFFQKNLNSNMLHTEYFSICNASTLEPASPDDRELVILAAVHIGSTRLIDNITLILT